MRHTHRKDKTLALAGLLRRIGRGRDPKLLCGEISELAGDIDSDDITAAEQTLVDEGYPCRLAHQLSATFVLMALHRAKDGHSSGELSSRHILRKIMVEHDLTRCFLADLNDVTEDILGLDSLTDTSSEFRNLAHIVFHLAAMKEHIDREEDIIFPFITKHGWPGLCQASQADHSKIKADILNLVVLIRSFNMITLEDFKAQLIAIVRRFSATTWEHISYEDDLLFPIALVVIDEVKVWGTIKAICDDIGYCSVHA